MNSKLSESKLQADLHLQTFQSFAHRPATQVERKVLEFVVETPRTQSLAISPRDVKSDFSPAQPQRPTLWVHGLRPEAIAYLAASASHASLGQRVLFLSNDQRQLEERQMRFASRSKVSLFNPASKTARPAEPGGFLLYCSIDNIDETRLCRIWGAEGPDVIIIENAHVLSPYSHEFRAKGHELATLQKRWPEARLVLESARLSGEERQECEERLGIYEQQPALCETLGTLRLEVFAGKAEKKILQKPTPSENSRDHEALDNSIEGLAERLPRPALFLAQSPSQVDQIYARLMKAQVPVHRLHSAMPESERGRELLQFTLPGRRAIMVSTMRQASTRTQEPPKELSSSEAGAAILNKPEIEASLLAGQEASAVPDHFGRGYARADIRSIVHLDAPRSLAQYCQDLTLLASHCLAPADAAKDLNEEQPEEPRAIVFADPQDLIAAHEQLGARGPAAELLEAALPYLAETGPKTSSSALALQLGVSSKRLNLVLAYLGDTGAFIPVNEAWDAGTDGRKLLIAGQRLVDELGIHRSADALRLAKVEKFWEDAGCRRQALLSLLGEESKICGKCDHCSGYRKQGDPQQTIKGQPRRRRAS